MLFPAHLWVRKFFHKYAPTDKPWIETYLSKILASMNGQGLERQKVLTRELLDAVHFSSLLIGCFSSSTNIHTHAS